MGFKEGYLEYPGGTRIRYRLNNNIDRTNVVYIHGLGERLEMYDFLFPLFENAGLALNSVELRGHGDSSGEHKYIEDFSLYIKDLKRFLTGNLKKRPVYLVGHSTGAMVVLRTAQDRRIDIKGVSLVSPLIDTRYDLFVKMAIIGMSFFMPQFIIPFREEDFYNLTHVRENAVMLLEESRRTVMGVTSDLVRAFYRERGRFIDESGRIKDIPMQVFLAGNDIIIDTESVKKLLNSIYDDTGNLEIISCNECYHAILLEENREEYVKKITDWIVNHENLMSA